MRKPSKEAIGTPLTNRRWEALAHEFIKGTPLREAGLNVGMKDSPHLAKNVHNIKTKPAVQARMRELAMAIAEAAVFDDAYVLSRAKEIADSSIAHFLQYNDDGTLMLDRRGRPKLDFKKATAETLRSILGFELDSRGRLKLRLRDPMPALELLARNRGLLVDKMALTDPTGEAPARLYVISDRPMSEDEWQKLCVKPG